MCLVLKNWYTRKRKAKTDIVVYKHLYKTVIDGESYYLTPYRNTPVKMGETYDSGLKREKENKVHVGLHSFAFINECKEDAKYEKTFPFISVVVVCEIPKDSKFYEGEF